MHGQVCGGEIVQPVHVIFFSRQWYDTPRHAGTTDPIMAFKLDWKQFRNAIVVLIAAFLMTQDFRTSVMLGLVDAGATLLFSLK